MKYETVYDGDWVTPRMNGYKMRCCDCGLVHTINFKVKGKQVHLQVFRNNYSTGQTRRHMRLKDD